jgi:hypothetical protein
MRTFHFAWQGILDCLITEAPSNVPAIHPPLASPGSKRTLRNDVDSNLPTMAPV